MLVSATLNNLYLSTLNTVAFLLLLPKLQSPPFPLKQLLLITCKLTIAYFWFSCSQCSAIFSNLNNFRLSQPLPFCCYCPNFQVHPFHQGNCYSSLALLWKPIFFTFIFVTDAHLSHFKQPSSFKVKYSCLFVVAA